ncbi:MAG: TatD DNase family protein [Pelagibacterales bacterium]|jgi:TatD DNase family protein|nr:TatD DNase family protein [Pelagibacterales bacterium]
MIIDSHCHLTYEPMVNSLEETINRANKDGVKFFLTISTVDKSFDKILTILKNYKCVFGSYGIHPHEAKNHTEIKSKDIINRVNKDKKIIGIGESGLDFYYNYSDKNDQINSFLEHIDASQKTQLPLIVHTRSAEEETLKILREAKIKKDFKILIHCFTGSKKFAFDLLDLGAYISASGVVTFKKSIELADTFRQIPDNRILVETDSPYLAPVPLRGKPNEPSYIVHTVEFLSKLKNISYDDFAKITTQNFFKLFGELN